MQEVSISAPQEEIDMTKKIVVLGFGPVGKAATELLMSKDREVCVAQRSKPGDLPKGASFERCDVLNAADVEKIVANASQIVVTIGFTYNSEVWRKSWPVAMANLLAACKAHNVRMVFVDNLYMYGAQNEPLRETMAMTAKGVKPAVRAEITRMWMNSGVRVAALRAPDFYGPGVTLSHIGESGFGAIAKGKRAMLLAPPDTLHDFAYVPDMARAVVSFLDAGDDVYGQVWHMPCAPTRTPREIPNLGAASLGVKAKVSGLPLWLLPIVGLGIPMLREFSEMSFLLDRPYRVNADKFAKRFWSDATPFEIGAPIAAASFKRK
jgi:nucleoside-diphosphate-sugar epimerase